MALFTTVPRHINRGFLMSALLYYSRKIITNLLMSLGILVASFTLLFTLFPLALILLLGFMITRWVQLQLLHRRYPNETAIKTNQGFSSFDYMYTDYVAFLTTLNGIVCEEEIIHKLHQQYVKQKLANSKHSGNGSWWNLNCTLKNRYGFAVWAIDDNFDIRKHIFTFGHRNNGRSITRKNIKETVANLCRQLPAPGRSPWEICLFYFNSYSRKPDCTALLIRVHRFFLKSFPIPLLNLMDQKPSFLPVTFNCTSSLTSIKPLFSKESSTTEMIHIMITATVNTIRKYKAKCDPNVSYVDSNTDPLWTAIRTIIKIISNLNRNLQKLNDSCTEFNTTIYRVSWAKSLALINLMPRLLCSLLDRIWEVNISQFLQRAFIFVSNDFPLWIFQFFLCLTQRIIDKIFTIFSYSLKIRRAYKTPLLLKQSLKELHLMYAAIVYSPVFLFHELFYSRSHASIFHSDEHNNLHPTIAFSETLPLDLVRKVAEVTKSNIFDVLLCAVSGALSEYVKENNLLVSNIKISIPIYDQTSLCNNESQFLKGYLKIKVPTAGITDIYHRLKIIKEIMASAPTEFQFFLSCIFHKYFASLLPNFVASYISNTSSNSSIYLFNTTVNFKSQSLTICDKDIKSIYCWKQNKSPSMSLITCEDKVTLIVVGNPKSLPHPEVITSNFTKELLSLISYKQLKLSC